MWTVELLRPVYDDFSSGGCLRDGCRTCLRNRITSPRDWLAVELKGSGGDKDFTSVSDLNNY